MYTEQDIQNIDNRALKKINLANKLAEYTYSQDLKTKVQSFTVSVKGTSYTEVVDRRYNTSCWQHRKNGNKAYRGHKRLYLVNAADIILDVWEWGENDSADTEIKKALKKWGMSNFLLQSY